jgi:hypothetical protein
LLDLVGFIHRRLSRAVISFLEPDDQQCARSQASRLIPRLQGFVAMSWRSGPLILRNLANLT